MDVMRDKTVPWPLRGYYMLSNYSVTARLMWQLKENEYMELLNPTIREFIKNPSMHLYTAQDESMFIETGAPFDEQYDDLIQEESDYEMSESPPEEENDEEDKPDLFKIAGIKRYFK